MAQIIQNYLQFLQYSLDEGRSSPISVSGMDWMQMMEWAEEQAIVGIIYGGILRAGKALGMPFDALMAMNYIITGGTGFIGTHLTNLILAA